MTEVASRAGVSQTTVSLVLNDASGARLSRETRQRVLDAANDLGYRISTRKLTQPDSGGAIGFIADEFATDPWMALAMDGMREKAWESGITIKAASTRGDAAMERAVFREMLSQPLIGLIYGTVNTRRVNCQFLPRDINVVLLNCYVADRAYPSVQPAEIVGGHLATKRLIDAGHRRIGLINGEPWMDASRDRLKGYRQAHASADLPIDPDMIHSGNWEPSEGYRHTQELMALPVPPTAIFCANDIMALGCFEALKEIGLRIPDDVSVIGYDDRELAQYMHPPLTTILLPHMEMGSFAAEYLIEQNARPMSRPTQVKIEGNLIERGSVRDHRSRTVVHI